MKTKINIKSKKSSYIILIIIIILLMIGIMTYSVLALKNGSEETTEVNAEIKENEVPLEEDNSEISMEELEENTKEKNNKNSNANNEPSMDNSNYYYIKINYGANVVTIYTKDENGEYSVPVKAMVCSTGRATPTSGTYTIKSRWRWLTMLGGVYAQYTTQVVGNILLHSVPYLEKGNPASLEYWEYDKLRNKSICRMY